MTKIILTILVSLILSVNIMGSRKMSVSHYLQSKYLGKIIMYKEETKVQQSEVKEIIFTKSGYEALLKNQDRVKFEFFLLQNSIKESFQENKRNLQDHVLNSTKFVNAVMAQVGNSQAENSTVSQYYSSLNNEGGREQVDSFDSFEEIIYTEIQNNKVKTGLAFATIKGIYLENGLPIEIKMVKDNDAN